MTRRDFVRRASCLAAAGLFARNRLAAATVATEPRSTPGGFGTFTPLRRNVGLFTGRGGTIGWWAGAAGLVVVDTQYPDTAATLVAGLPGRAGRSIDVVLNTHHHADHTSGNPVLRAAAKTIVAQTNVPKLQFAAASRADGNPKPSGWAPLEKQVYADTTFDDAWRHDAGEETISAQYFGPAHTSGDSVILFEKANVVHVGDLVFNRIYPVIDRVAGGSVRGWISALERVVAAYPADAIYIYGHGSARFGVSGPRADLLVMRDYWSAVLALVGKGIAAGHSRAEICAQPNLPGFADFQGSAPGRLPANLAAAYDELTGAKA